MRRRRLIILQNGPLRPSPYRSSRRQCSPKMAWRALAQSSQIDREIIRQAQSKPDENVAVFPLVGVRGNRATLTRARHVNPRISEHPTWRMVRRIPSNSLTRSARTHPPGLSVRAHRSVFDARAEQLRELIRLVSRVVGDCHDPVQRLFCAPRSLRDKIDAATHDLEDVPVCGVIGEIDEPLTPVDVGREFSLDHSFKQSA